MVGAATALIVTLGVGWVMIRLGPVLGFVDLPDGYLKSHRVPAVPLGGVALFLGVNVATAVNGTFDDALAVACALVLLAGLVDDRFGLSRVVRVVVEVTAGLVLTVSAHLPALPARWVGLLIMVVLVVVASNAVNLFDGLDGLAGSSALVAAVGIAALAAQRGLDQSFGLVVAAALAGFLVWNWHPARLFLGDNGAYVVAVMLAYGVVGASPRGDVPALFVATLLLGVFALDLVVTLVRRVRAGAPLFLGDRDHLYDRLHASGRSVQQVALVMAAVEVVFVLVVLALDRY